GQGSLRKIHAAVKSWLQARPTATIESQVIRWNWLEKKSVYLPSRSWRPCARSPVGSADATKIAPGTISERAERAEAEPGDAVVLVSSLLPALLGVWLAYSSALRLHTRDRPGRMCSPFRGLPTRIAADGLAAAQQPGW